MRKQSRFSTKCLAGSDELRSPARPSVMSACGEGLLREAHDHMSRAAAQMRDPKAALYGCFYLGLLYSQQRDVVEAERYFRKTLSLAPNFIEAYYELGRTFWLTGGTDGSGERVEGRQCSEPLQRMGQALCRGDPAVESWQGAAQLQLRPAG